MFCWRDKEWIERNSYVNYTHGVFILRFNESNLLQLKETNRLCFFVGQPPSYAVPFPCTVNREKHYEL